MGLGFKMLLIVARSLCLGVGLASCRAATESDGTVEWKVSWTPPLTHEDNTPIRTQPTYELEMAANEYGQGPWKVVWRGTTTTAVFKASPGRHCFRAVTVENGVRSQPSQIHCATKPAS
jgi:hypothetical protein